MYFLDSLFYNPYFQSVPLVADDDPYQTCPYYLIYKPGEISSWTKIKK